MIVKKIKALFNRLKNSPATSEHPVSLPELKDEKVKKPTLDSKIRKKHSKGRYSRKKTGHSAKRPDKAHGASKASTHRWSISDFCVPPLEGKTRFHDIEGIPDNVMHAIADMGFEYCTPVQAEILPHILKRKDAIGKAQTGTGKTAAFLIAAITKMLRNPVSNKRSHGTPRVLVITPTRELAMQIEAEAKALTKYCHFNVMSVFGGMDYERQRKILTDKVVDMVVATPGRLLDFYTKHDLSLNKIETLVIDEADRMLDMGFIPDVRRIIRAIPPKAKRQTMLFSATITPEVKRLAQQWTTDPVTVDIKSEQVTVDTVTQIVYIITSDEKYALLYNVIERQKLSKVIIFCNRKDETRRVSEMLSRYGINTAILSGDISQKRRVRTLKDFKNGKIRVLVATDVAGRGIHVEGISHVINYTLPHQPENYVHRIGRTGRAGSLGTAISFASETDSFYIPEIEKFIKQKLVCTMPDEDWLKLPPKRSRTKSGHPSRKRKKPSKKTG